MSEAAEEETGAPDSRPVSLPPPEAHASAEGREPFPRTPRWPLTLFLLVGLVVVFSIPYVLRWVPVGEMLVPGSLSAFGQWRMGALLPWQYLWEEPWRIALCVHLHGWLPHLLLNGMVLLSLGRFLERLVTPGRYLAVYVLSGWGGALASAAFLETLSVGASGAILGLGGACVVTLLRRRRDLPPGVATATVVPLAAMLLFAVGLGFVLEYFGSPIDNAAHVGGVLTGALVAALPAPRGASVLGTVLFGALVVVALGAIGTITMRSGDRDGWYPPETSRHEIEELRVELELPRSWRTLDPKDAPESSGRVVAFWKGWDSASLVVNRHPPEPAKRWVKEIPTLFENAGYAVEEVHRRDLLGEGPGGVLVAWRVGAGSPDGLGLELERQQVFRIVEAFDATITFVVETGPTERELEWAIEWLRSIEAR